MRAHTNISLKDRKHLAISDFRGADFSSSVTQASLTRAIKMRNLINRGGVNRKRNGWNEILQIEGNPRINGVFEYDSNTLVIHAGTRFYRAKKANGKYTCEDITQICTYKNAEIVTSEIKNQRSQAFLASDRLYVVGCGDYLVYGTWDGGKTYELRRVVEDKDTYVPTTARIYPNVIEGATRTKGNVEALETPNLLTRKRTVAMFGSSDKSIAMPGALGSLKESIWEWSIGEKVDTEKEILIEVDALENGKVVSYTITNENLDGGLGGDLYIKSCDSYGSYGTGLQIGSLSSYGTVRIFLPSEAPDEATPNITLTYHVECLEEDYTKKICNAAFGITYGVNGNVDRLFLSGNLNHKATVFYSVMDDFTYFPDVNTISVGMQSVPITAFARLSDNALAVFKKESSRDASLFTLGGTYTSTEDENGTTTSFSALFPKSAGAEGEGAVNAYTCANLMGDTLLLSRNGVFGVALQENVMTTVRCTRERSRLIAEKLKTNENLADAVATVYDGRYYLAVDDVCYVADARHKYTADASDGSFNYEWWYWDNIPARVWSEIGGKLAFGTNDGRVCVFDDEYTDRTYLHTASGEFSLDIAEKRLICNETLYDSASDGAEIVIESEGLYALVEKGASTESGRIATANENGIFSFYEGMQLYADGTSPYTVTDIDFGEGTYALKDENGELMTQNEGFYLYRSLSGETLFIEKEDGAVYLKEAKEGKRLALASYNNTTLPEIRATVKNSVPVVAEWVTPVFDLGTNLYSKTLLKMSVSTAPETRGKLSFGYETRNAQRFLGMKGKDLFSFENFSFNTFSFDTGFANSYSVRCNERNFNYILFRFLSDDDGDCAVSDFSVVYKINRENKGVR